MSANALAHAEEVARAYSSQKANLVGRFSQADLRAWHLEAIAGFRTDGFLNVRGILDGRPPINEFHPLGDIDGASALVAKVAATHNAYVRVTPCDRKDGKAATAMPATVLTLDCDTPDATATGLALCPNFAIWSGSPGASHLTWITKPNGDLPKWARRVAASVGADMRATDAARLFRVGGTFNYKHSPPRPVDYFYVNLTGAERSVEELFGHLPEIDNVRKLPTSSKPRTVDPGDPLATIEPAAYISALVGIDVQPNSHIRCPFHDDRTPSMFVYDNPDRGQTCFGCGKGSGTIIDFGAALYGIEPRGRGFHEIRERLTADLIAAAARQGVAA